MTTVILDTNVVLRFLLADDPRQSPKARALFEAAEAGTVRLYLSHVIFAELVWTLDSFFHFPPAEIGAKLRGLAVHDGIELDELDELLAALDRYARFNVDFPDAYVAALSATRSQTVVTYDKDFRKFKDITVKTPDELKP
jgi:predicted nucleic acid-binding protein